MISTYPQTIENCVGEKLVFKGVENAPEGEKLIVEAFCNPGAGPAMHTHFKQDESLTVLSGSMGYQVPGQPVKIAHVGDTVLFKRGTPHKFWAENGEPLHCSGWIQPVNSLPYFLSAVYAAQNKSGKGEPDPFDAAYLLTKYATEYDMPEIPSFVKKVIFPITVFIGKLSGKYAHFKDAPAPLK
ncbi:MAG: cupin domain-containing protein [Saprospiraceae bacterium]|jgi:quercetin dioxygenase-like cupin family protein|nr:cupin domain-containing protein [Saprospiraceae bacterium]